MASQAPFGVLNNPVKVPSGNNSRTVGCTGGSGGCMCAPQLCGVCRLCLVAHVVSLG